MRQTGRIASFILASAALAAGLSACGGARQDANEPSGTFKVSVTKAAFPPAQQIAQKTQFVIQVRNDDSRALPDPAVTVTSFSEADKAPGLADPSRPVWIVDDGPHGGTTAYTNTWSLGHALKPHGVATFTWAVTPIKPGKHTVKYRVAAGLDGKAKAQLAGGRIPQGSLTVNVSGKPAQACVTPDGKVVKNPDPKGALTGDCSAASSTSSK